MRRCFLAVAVLALAACSAWADDAESSDVLVLTDSSMKAVLADHDAAGILVKFYAPWCGHCKNLAPTYEKVATALKGDVAVAKIDATENPTTAQQFGVRGYPTVVLVKGGLKYKFKGKRTVEALSEFAKNGDAAGDGEKIGAAETEEEYDGPDHVIPLTDANFEELTQAATGATTGDWVVMFYAPWCGHCKKLHPTLKAVAAELKGKVNVASVDATQHTATARRFSIRSYPTVKLFSQGREFSYAGKRTKTDMVEWATGGFTSEDGVEVGAAPGLLEQFTDEFAAEWDVLKKDMSTLMRFKKNALIVTFSAGAVFGVLLAFGLFACLGGLTPPVEAAAAQAADSAAGADAVSGAGEGAGAGSGASADDRSKPKKE